MRLRLRVQRATLNANRIISDEQKSNRTIDPQPHYSQPREVCPGRAVTAGSEGGVNHAAKRFSQPCVFGLLVLSLLRHGLTAVKATSIYLSQKVECPFSLSFSAVSLAAAGARCVFRGASNLVVFGKLHGVSFELHESQNARVKKPYRVPHLHKQLQNDSKPTSCQLFLTQS